MKKLRMIVTSVIVLAIVGSAFAFKTKAGYHCIKTGAPGNCTTYVQARITFFGGNSYRYFPFWDGTKSQCTQDNLGRCTSEVRLTEN